MESGEYFGCSVLCCTLTRLSCARRSSRADRLVIVRDNWQPYAWKRLVCCRNCPIGAQHARELVVYAPDAPPARPERPVGYGPGYDRHSKVVWWQSYPSGEEGETLMDVYLRQQAQPDLEPEREDLRHGAWWVKSHPLSPVDAMLAERRREAMEQAASEVRDRARLQNMSWMAGRDLPPEPLRCRARIGTEQCSTCWDASTHPYCWGHGRTLGFGSEKPPQREPEPLISFGEALSEWAKRRLFVDEEGRTRIIGTR